jgi:S-adenosylmethionine:tRNA ribosyltransferase-isomerase
MEAEALSPYSLDLYDYELPAELVAQTPAGRREDSRLLALSRASGTLFSSRFRDIPEFLDTGDLVVVNDTRVVPARLIGTKATGGRVELLVLEPYRTAPRADETICDCLIKASKPPRPGSRILLEAGFRAETAGPVREGIVPVRFLTELPLLELLGRIGRVPLPPYIQRKEETPRQEDRFDYQTVYAHRPGAVAAPTAGLHFTPAVMEQLERKGVEFARVTLHVGYGTFSPVRVRDIRDHRLHPEYAEISEAAAGRIRQAKQKGRRVLAVGTTVVRVLEWAATVGGPEGMEAVRGMCDHYIYPGYRFRTVDAMLTNFHLPRSSLLLLVSAFAGRENVLAAYRYAVGERYRFYSYGDAMLIW